MGAPGGGRAGRRGRIRKKGRLCRAPLLGSSNEARPHRSGAFAPYGLLRLYRPHSTSLWDHPKVVTRQLNR